jgi:integrase
VAAITKIVGKKATHYRAQIKRAGRKSIAKTFGTRREAEQWARRIETGLDQQHVELATADITVGQLIEEFRRARLEIGRPVGESTNTHYMLAHLVEDLGSERLRDLTPQRLAAWARERKAQGAGGYTVNMELSQLGTVIRHTASFLNATLPDVVALARPLLGYAQLIGGGGRRSRRPSEDELARLLAWLDERDRRVADAVRVSAVIGLRRGELARIAWSDVNELQRAILVRQRKHPRRVEARDEWVPLLGPAWDIVQRQPRDDARVFPLSPEKMTDMVTAGTRALGIPDLRLHDMRREATSALRDLGFDKDARKKIVGHRSDEIHERYTAITLESLHDQYTAAQGKLPRRSRRRKVPGPTT